ncbi:MAG: dephospho-CoA kinase [Alphaproteobacteria bacterium]|nr:dephospho-CoA kinase [Alphaproteobacteria bacterium]
MFVAITGSIGCGKTTISNILRKHNFIVNDVDEWCRELYYKNDFLEMVIKRFPETKVDGKFNKRILRNLVFDDVKKLRILESIIHPYLTKKLLDCVNDFDDEEIVFTDVALLYEMGWNVYFDYVVLADVDYETQKQRVMNRDGISGDDFDKINNIQMKREEKISKVNMIIDTGCSKEELENKVINMIKEIKKWKR